MVCWSTAIPPAFFVGVRLRIVGSSEFLVEISTTECSEAPSATRKVAMEKTSAKYQPPQTRLSGDLQDTATNINAIGVCPQLWGTGNGEPGMGNGERGTGASRVSQILLIMCLKKLSRRFCFGHIIYRIYRIGELSRAETRSRPLRVGAPHREATKPSSSECQEAQRVLF